MENNKTNNKQKGFFSDYPKSSGVGLGLICGLFSVLGLIGGFLYPQESLQREEFIRGWKIGFFFSLIVTIILVILKIKG